MPDTEAPHVSSHLAGFLADQDLPCPACNYNLRGLKTDRCPECNRELVLQIRLAEPRIGAWIASLAAAAAMLGFNGLLCAYFLWFFVIRGKRYGPSAAAVLTLVVGSVVAAFVLSNLIRRRREFGNLSSNARQTLAVGAWVLTAASAITFFMIVD